MAKAEERMEAEQRYIASTITLRDLAEEMSISAGTLMRWSREGAWAEKRRQAEMKASEKAMKSAAKKRAKQLEKLLDASVNLESALQTASQQILSALEENKKMTDGKMADGFRAKNLQSLAAAIGTATQTRMLLDGIMTESEKQKLRIEKKKLAMEEAQQEQKTNGKSVEVILPPEVKEMAE